MVALFENSAKISKKKKAIWLSPQPQPVSRALGATNLGESA